MAIVSDVEIRLRADIARLQQDLTAARRSVDTAMGGISRAAETAKAALAGLGVGIGLKELLMQVVDAQREFDKLNASLVTATGSVSKAATAYKALQQFAATTPYSVAQATEAFIKLKNQGLDPSERALRSYGNTASSQSKSLDQFIEAVADASRGQFERLQEFAISAKQNGDRVSLTFQGVTKSVGNNAKDIQAYLMSLGEVQFAGAMERQANTLNGVISNLGDSWNAFLLKVSGGGLGDRLASGLLTASNALSDFGDILDRVGDKVKDENGKIQESSQAHTWLTNALKALATIAISTYANFELLRVTIVDLTVAAAALVRGDLAGAKAALEARVKDTASVGEWAVAKRKALWGNADAAKAAQDAETKAAAEGGKDRLAQFKVEQSADEKRNNALLAIADIRKKLLGVDPQDLADQKKIQTALETGAITQKEYNTLMAESNKQIQANSLAYKQQQKNLDGQAESIKRAAEAYSLLNQRQQDRVNFQKQTGAIDDMASIEQTAKLQIDDLNNQIAAQQKLLAIAKQRQDSQKDQKDIDGQIANLRLKIDTAQEKRDQDIFLLEQQRYRLAVNNTADLIEAAQAETKAQQDRTRDQQDEIESLGLTSKQVAELTAVRMRDQATALEMRAQISIIDEVADAYRRQADELRKQADLVVSKEQIQSYQKFWGDVEQTAHDTFVSIADGGKDAFTRLKQSAKNIFFDWLYQMTLKKWIISIGSSVDGPAAVAGLAGNSGLSALTQGGSLLSSAGSLYSALTGGLTASGGVGTGFVGSLVGGLNGAGAGAPLGSALGLQIGNTIASTLGPTLSSALSTGISGLAKALPWVGGAVAVYSLAKAAFGRGPKQYSDSSTLSGSLGNGMFSGQVGTDYTQKGGWFRSDKHGTDFTAVDDTTVKALTTTYDTIKAANSSYAKALGVSADMITNRTDQIKIALGKDDAANQKAITDYFAGISDAIATSVLPNIGQFQQSGETASATLQRVSTDFVAIDAILQAMGTDSQAAFKAVGTASIEARERLIKFAGGLDALVSQTQYFNDNFLTDAEKLAPVQKDLAAALASVGMSSITTTDQFKAAVQALVASGALATEEGAKQYATLLAIAPKFKQVADALKEADNTAVELLRNAASDAFGVLQRSVDARKKELQTSFDAVMKGIEASIDAASAKVSDLQSLSDALKNTNLPGTTIDRSTAQAQVAAAVAIARAGGVLPKADDLRGALDALGQDVGDKFATLQDFQRDQLRTANNIEELSGLTDNQLSTAEQTLKVLQDQKQATQDAYDAEVARLDNMVAAAQMQLDAINGVNTSVQDVVTAFANFAGSISAALQNKTIASQPSVTDKVQIEALYQSILGRPSDDGGLAFFLNNLQSGNTTLGGVADALKNSAEYQASHPPVIDSAVQTGTMNNGSAMLAQLQTLNTRMANVETHVGNTASSTGKFAQQFDQVSAGGNALLTEAN